MGCGGSKDNEEGLHAKLRNDMRHLDAENLDNLFKEAGEVIEQIEMLREIIVDNRDDLVMNSGACSLTDPTLLDCIYGICWKLSADNSGNFIDADIDMDLDAKCVVVKGKKNSAESTSAIESMNEYAKGIVELPDKMTDLAEKMQGLANTFTDNLGSYTSELTEKFAGNPLKIPGKISILRDNVSRITKAATLVPKLVAELTNNVKFIVDEVPKLFKNGEKILAIDDKGKKAHKDKHTRAYEIVWNSIEDVKRRHGKKPEDGLKFWDQRKKNKLAAKAKVTKK